MTAGTLARIAAVPAVAEAQPTGRQLPPWKCPPTIEAPLAEVEQQLRRLLSRSIHPWANQVSGHLFAGGGKRLRPAVVLMSAALGDGGRSGAIKAAAAVELLHLATLHHDDIMDGADERRGLPSVNRLWGNRVAAIGGTYLFSLSISAFAALGQESNRWASQAATELWQGQTRECELAFNTDIEVDQYFEHIGGKTASMFVLSCRLGAVHGGLGVEEAQGLADYGLKLGLAFQVMDDVLDVTGDVASLGKPHKLDLGEGVYTLPTILCLQDRDHGADLRALLDRDALGPAEVIEAQALISASGAVDKARKVVGDLVRDAVAALRAFPESETKTHMTALADWVAARAK